MAPFRTRPHSHHGWVGRYLTALCPLWKLPSAEESHHAQGHTFSLGANPLHKVTEA